MKSILTLALTIGLATFALPASAESRDQHQDHGKTSDDCMAMQKMDHSKMDMNDPAMKAMHERCMQHMHGSGHEGGTSEHDQSAPQGGTGADGGKTEHDHDKTGN